MDPSLNDNAGGFNNFAAPGADRLKITTSLIKKELDDFDDNNFVELATVENGVLRSKPNSGQYNLLNDELARRTYAESGDYYVHPFGIDVKNSLNNSIITVKSHKLWIKKFVNKKNKLYIVSTSNKPIGYIRLELINNSYNTSWALYKKYQNKGYAKRSLIYATKNKKYKYKAIIKKKKLIFTKSC